jgi:hypothetical protein
MTSRNVINFLIVDGMAVPVDAAQLPQQSAWFRDGVGCKGGRRPGKNPFLLGSVAAREQCLAQRGAVQRETLIGPNVDYVCRSFISESSRKKTAAGHAALTPTGVGDHPGAAFGAVFCTPPGE